MSGASRTLRAQPLSAEAFSPFGDVIDAATAAQALDINEGFATRFHDLAAIDVNDDGGRVCVSLFRSRPAAPPVVVRLMERHPLGSQAFIPLERRPFLVVVAPPGPLRPADIRAFRARGDQGVNYAKGVWHHFLLALEAQSDFLVIDRAGPGNNVDEIELAANERIVVEC